MDNDTGEIGQGQEEMEAQQESRSGEANVSPRDIAVIS